jgi:hypothetical protein
VQADIEGRSSASRRSPDTASATISSAPALVAAQGFPDLGALMAKHRIADADAYPLSKELLLLWTMRAP